jgi:Uma2 family endonuclease
MSADARPNAKPRIPSLRNGQRLTRTEFMRRWEAMPELKHAERIEGKVSIMTPPISLTEHGNPHFLMIGILAEYSMATPGIIGFSDSTVHIDGDNDFQPDIGLAILPEFGGQTRRVGKYLAGAPELVVEIAASSVVRDLGRKSTVYRRAGVLEFLIWRTPKGSIDCFLNREGQFEPAERTDGVFKSICFPGLWIDLAALIAGDLAKVRATTAAGLADPAHARFKRKLAKARKG